MRLPGAARASLVATTEELRARVDGVRWVPPENLHVTIAFLGSVDDPGTVVDALRRVRARGGTGALGELLAFPRPSRARVLAVAVVDDGILDEAARAVWAALGPLGFAPEDRPFRAHVTVGRLRRPTRVRLEVSVRAAQVPIDELTLFRSDLSGRAPVYEVVERFALGAS